MATTDITLNGNTSGVLECSLTYTREGYVPWVSVTGGNVQIETTIFQNTDFPDNVRLKEQWVGTATNDQKNQDPKKTDVYSRFSTDPEEEKYTDLDSSLAFSQTPADDGPKLYRDFKASTFDYDTSDEAISASAMIKDTTWKFSGDLGIGARFQSGAIPYIRLQAGKRELEKTYSTNDKAITCIIEGRSLMRERAYEEGTDNDWFVPTAIVTTDRFMMYKVVNSYRDNPDNDPTSDVNKYLRDDRIACENYAKDILQTTTIPPISGSITMTGSKQFSIGGKIGQIITRNGEAPVNLAIVDQSTQYAPPRQAGEAGQDTITIELGRK
jgi:hypothetical protein